MFIGRKLTLELDDELCLCFHVTKRKVLNYIRIEQPQRPAQLSDCFGAGTGCGWCRPFLKNLLAQAQRAEGDDDAAAAEPTTAEYARRRTQYVRDGKGTPPPGATPLV